MRRLEGRRPLGVRPFGLVSVVLGALAVGAPLVASGVAAPPAGSATPGLRASPPVRLLAYPAAYRNQQGRLVFGLVPTSVAQMTTLVPHQRRIGGVVIIVYWSVLEPRPGVFRWRILDDVLRYWGARGKKVVLNPVTTGVPVQFPASWGGVQDGLPRWVARRARTLPGYRTSVFGSHGARTTVATVPVSTDPHYLAAYRSFIGALGRHVDGNPTLAYVRIGTGRMGEEYYPYTCGPQTWPAAVCAAAARQGWNPVTWYRSLESVVADYRSAFPRTALSLDIGLLGDFLGPHARAADRDAASARSFLSDLEHHSVMLGFNGLSSNLLRSPTPVARQDLRVLEGARAEGRRVELETYGDPSNPSMDDPAAILTVIRRLGPSDLNLFGEYWGLDAYVEGDHRSPASVGSWQFFRSALEARRLSERAIVARADGWHRFLEALGGR